MVQEHMHIYAANEEHTCILSDSSSLLLSLPTTHYIQYTPEQCVFV